MNIDEIRSELKGYHVEIQLWPTGGEVCIRGCEECDTVEDFYDFETWKHHKAARSQTIEDAVAIIKGRLKDR